MCCKLHGVPQNVDSFFFFATSWGNCGKPLATIIFIVRGCFLAKKKLNIVLESDANLWQQYLLPIVANSVPEAVSGEHEFRDQ